MFPEFWHPSFGPPPSAVSAAPGDAADGDGAVTAPRVIAPRADCCAAAAVYRVVLASGADLVMCAHHLRDAASALHEAAARVLDADGQPAQQVRVIRAC